MLRAAYIQVQQAGRPDREAVALLEELPRRGIEATTFTLKQLSRRRLGLAPDVLVAGGMEAVRGALKQLGRTGTELPTYPLSLRDRLGRTVWEATLGEALRRVETRGEPLFIKPRLDSKRFTGLVLRDASESFRLAGASRGTPVWCAEPIEIVAEHRAYVVEGQVVAVAQYDGSPRPAPSAWIDATLQQLIDGGEAPAGFAIDVATKPGGEPVLMECNDGFALGQYDGVSNASYVDLVCARWRELVGAD
ncbi:MAG: ATP-grasp domain-containing protein [Sandaracinaceae bacterium]|nr:ATP-grasp domain-containing protein [Sandaracinaceae bacterium]